MNKKRSLKFNFSKLLHSFIISLFEFAGIGLAYTVGENGIYFCATARREHGDWAGEISRLLDEALIEMKLLHDFEKMPSSKL